VIGGDSYGNPSHGPEYGKPAEPEAPFDPRVQRRRFSFLRLGAVIFLLVGSFLAWRAIFQIVGSFWNSFFS